MALLRVGACLSLSGRYARFGLQAAHGLDAWRRLDGGAEVLVEDDGSDPRRLEPAIRRMSGACDLLLGPYSTRLVLAAGRVLPDLGRLLWNHGGAGENAQVACPGLIVSVLAPAGRYAEPFVRLAAATAEPAPLWIAHGRGSFGRQVAAGADAAARRLGLRTPRLGPGEALSPGRGESAWDLMMAGSFEEDVARFEEARQLARPPRLVCAVAAGVREFRAAVTHPNGTYGVAQWFDGQEPPSEPDLGPGPASFHRAYEAVAGTPPDYPAAQAAAAAVVATHCARTAGGLDVRSLWSAATGLDTTTLFGRFRVDPASGAQVAHGTVLLRWGPEGLLRARP